MTFKFILILMFSLACYSFGSEPGNTGAGVAPELVDGNPTCADYGFQFSEKLDFNPENGTYSLGDGINTVTISNADGTYFDWSATLGIDKVIVKGGDEANLYSYSPERTSDTHLHPPITSSGDPAEISHVEFCFDYEVDAAKTADTSYDLTYPWTVDKKVRILPDGIFDDNIEITISQNQSVTLEYQIKVEKGTGEESNFAVSGEITVDNNTPLQATIENITDTIDDAPGDACTYGPLTPTVVCSAPFPISLASLGQTTCTYEQSVPNKDTCTNTAVVSTSGNVGGDTATAPIDFANADVNEIDECVEVTDDLLGGSLGETCAEKIFTKTYIIEPHSICETFELENTATATGIDSGAEFTDTATVTVNVVGCGGDGCTLTVGYWKTHSSYGPAAHPDATWELLGDADGDGTEEFQDEEFYLSGLTYYEILWTSPPKGNPYFILAHQFIAATLNGLAGADTSAVNTQLAFANNFFTTETPSTLSKTDKTNALTAAQALDNYNNGITGPGHCDGI